MYILKIIIITSILAMPQLLSQEEAKSFDQWLMSSTGAAYTLPQLMELAGLTIATIIQNYYPLSDKKKVFIAIGPGNNGGDGLVAARHLSTFNYSVTIYKPETRGKDQVEFFNVILNSTVAAVLTYPS